MAIDNVEPGGSGAIGPAVGFWTRGAAMLIDVAVLAVLTFPIGLVFPPEFDFNAWTLNVNPLGPLLDFTVIFGYFACLEGLRGATIGKRVLRLRITDSRGRPIGFLTAVGRNAGKILSILTLMIGFAMVAIDSRKQALHDKLARTLVVRM